MKIERVLVVDDEESVADWFRELLKDEGYFVRTAGSGTRALMEFERNHWDLVLIDLSLSDIDGTSLLRTLKSRRPGLIAIVMSESLSRVSEGVVRQADALLEKPTDLEPLGVLRLLRQLGERPEPTPAIIGKSPQIQRVLSVMDTVSGMDGHVLVIGEPGTGKQLIAGAIHAASARARNPLVRLVGSTSFQELADALVEANKGSLFIDRITDMSVDLQQRLRFILEEKQLHYRGSRAVHVDVRVLASINVDPEEAIRDSRLNRDLYYRIRVLSIRVPPLRERPTDILLLAWYLLARAAKKYGVGTFGINREAQVALQAYTWPGNVLELEQVMERAAIVAKGREIQSADLPDSLLGKASEPHRDVPAAEMQTPTLEEQERQAIIQALKATGWNKDAAARALGLHRPTLYAKMRRHGIPIRRTE